MLLVYSQRHQQEHSSKALDVVAQCLTLAIAVEAISKAARRRGWSLDISIKKNIYTFLSSVIVPVKKKK